MPRLANGNGQWARRGNACLPGDHFVSRDGMWRARQGRWVCNDECTAGMMHNIFESLDEDLHQDNDGGEKHRLEGKLFLVGLGAQKAGSTWMARYLATHPQVYVPRLKELHYFDAVYMPRLCGHVPGRLIRMAKGVAGDVISESGRMSRKKFDRLTAIIDRLQMTFDRKYNYMRFFEDRVTTEDVFCDITPAYSVLEVDGYEAILKTHPNVRFVFIMRDPVDRFWSAVRMGIRKIEGYEPYERVPEFLEMEEHVSRTDYKRTILALEKVVAADQIKYFFYENLFTPNAIDELTSFIGIKPWPANFDTIVNPGERLPMRPEHSQAAFQKFAHVYEFVFKRFGREVPAKWRKTVEAHG